LILDTGSHIIDKYEKIVEKHKDKPTTADDLLKELKEIRENAEQINQKIDADNILQRDIVYA
jgi:hypothetical protein